MSGSMLSRHWREIFPSEESALDVTCLDATEPMGSFYEV